MKHKLNYTVEVGSKLTTLFIYVFHSQDQGAKAGSMALRVRPWVHQEGVLHAITPISMKLGQFKGSTPKLKTTSWFIVWIFMVRYSPPPFTMRVCIYVDTSLKNARMKVSVNLIGSLLITGLEYRTAFLATQIFADFEIKYLSLPESYDNNFAIHCLPTLWSVINIKNISGLCVSWVSDAT